MTEKEQILLVEKGGIRQYLTSLLDEWHSCSLTHRRVFIQVDIKVWDRFSLLFYICGMNHIEADHCFAAENRPHPPTRLTPTL